MRFLGRQHPLDQSPNENASSFPHIMASSTKWPNGARTAIALTLDNMGEAADLNRGKWPASQAIGSHFSVIEALPKILALLKKYDVHVTYFIESWNLNQYPDSIRTISDAGHEVGWHAYQHEGWYTLKDSAAEKDNFARSFQAMKHFVGEDASGNGKATPYRGFRPPGGPIHGDRTLSLCRDFGLEYISPAAEHAAVVEVSQSGNRGLDSIVVLPYRWRNIDAYYYMDSFAGLREMKGEKAKDALGEEELVRRFISEIDDAIRTGEFKSFLFHPFLSNSVARLKAMEEVVSYLAEKRDQGLVWLARCCDVEKHVRQQPSCVSTDPQWDQSIWR